MTTRLFQCAVLFMLGIAVLGCTVADDLADDDDTDSVALTAAYEQFIDTLSVVSDGDYVTIESTGVPNHPSPYFTMPNVLYEAYNGSNASYFSNPNRIASQEFVFRIPLNPVAAADGDEEQTSMGPIGVAVNGVPLFNQYAAGRVTLTSGEYDTFDQYNGHPAMQGVYHYHWEPFYLTSTNGDDSLIGFLLDGFPVYGPEENNVRLTSAALDEHHGHVGVTAEYPDGIYHYHITDDSPYICGDTFYGVVSGTVSN